MIFHKYPIQASSCSADDYERFVLDQTRWLYATEEQFAWNDIYCLLEEKYKSLFPDTAQSPSEAALFELVGDGLKQDGALADDEYEEYQRNLLRSGIADAGSLQEIYALLVQLGSEVLGLLHQIEANPNSRMVPVGSDAEFMSLCLHKKISPNNQHKPFYCSRKALLHPIELKAFQTCLPELTMKSDDVLRNYSWLDKGYVSTVMHVLFRSIDNGTAGEPKNILQNLERAVRDEADTKVIQSQVISGKSVGFLEAGPSKIPTSFQQCFEEDVFVSVLKALSTKFSHFKKTLDSDITLVDIGVKGSQPLTIISAYRAFDSSPTRNDTVAVFGPNKTDTTSEIHYYRASWQLSLALESMKTYQTDVSLDSRLIRRATASQELLAFLKALAFREASLQHLHRDQ